MQDKNINLDLTDVLLEQDHYSIYLDICVSYLRRKSKWNLIWNILFLVDDSLKIMPPQNKLKKLLDKNIN